MGSGSSHELASLLVTETVQFSIHVLKEPCYLLLCDARSAFDRILHFMLVRELYLQADLRGSPLLLINNRLTSSKTIYDWQKKLLGPAHNDRGLEQGGINSSDFHKIYTVAQCIG